MLNNRIIPPLGLILALTFLSSCVYYNGDGSWGIFNDDWGNIRGSGYTESEIRPVSGIRSVRLDNQGDLTIELGDTESLVVEAEDNLLPFIVTEVRGGELHIYNEGRNWFRNRNPIRYHLTVKSLEGLSIGSTGSINAPDLSADRFEIGIRSTGNLVMGDLEAGDVDIDVSSTGDVMLRRLEAARLEVNISSTGHVSIRNGRVSNQTIRISSTGSYEAMDLDSNVAEVRLSSTGSAFISVNDYMEANLSSTGSVHYRGEARTDIRRNSVGKAILVSRR
jgi:hypothetical protein